MKRFALKDTNNGIYLYELEGNKLKTRVRKATISDFDKLKQRTVDIVVRRTIETITFSEILKHKKELLKRKLLNQGFKGLVKLLKL